jgi:uncharacterized lipoprotein YmbA
MIHPTHMKTIALFPFLLASSCGVLKPVKDAAVNHVLDAVVPERTVTGSSPAVAIARPGLPGYLDRQQLVSRGGDGRIMMNSYQVWAEPLDAGISRVTALNLGRLSNSLNIQPVETFVTLDYDRLLEIRVSRFEPDAAGNLVLECTWKLQPVSGRVTSPRYFRTVIAVPGTRDPLGPQAELVAAMNEALARLAREIAREL